MSLNFCRAQQQRRIRRRVRQFSRYEILAAIRCKPLRFFLRRQSMLAGF